MWIDSLSEFSDNQPIRHAGDVLCTKPLRVGKGDIGVGEPMWLFILIKEDFKVAGKASVQFILQTDEAEDFSSAQDVMSFGPMDGDSLKAGFKCASRLPIGLKAYLRVLYRVKTENDAAPTAGALSAALVLDIENRYAYPSGWRVHGGFAPQSNGTHIPSEDEDKRRSPQPPREEPKQPEAPKQPEDKAPEDDKPKLPPVHDKPKNPGGNPGPFDQKKAKLGA